MVLEYSKKNGLKIKWILFDDDEIRNEDLVLFQDYNIEIHGNHIHFEWEKD